MTSPVSGRVLPVTTSIIVVLPAPFGPMMARISPGSIGEGEIVERLEAVERDGDAVEVEKCGGQRFHRLILIPPAAAR